MKGKKRLVLCMILGCVLTAGLCGCQLRSNKSLDSMSGKELLIRALIEHNLNSVGMPDTWGNWKEIFTTLSDTYHIVHSDKDMGSDDEVYTFVNGGTQDIGDVSRPYALIAAQNDAVQPYKTIYWDTIPDWAKDKDGEWIVSYTGTMAFIINTDIVPNPPTSFAELLNGDYKVQIDDFTTAAQGQYALLAASFANGGDETDMTPAYQYFKTLHDQNRLVEKAPSANTLLSDNIGVTILWDFNACNYREQAYAQNPNAHFVCCIPSDGSIKEGYATIINKNAAHPAAAALAREYILSDEGQIALAKGYLRPIRTDVQIPEDIKSKWPPDSEYQNVHFIEDITRWRNSYNAIETNWKSIVGELPNGK